MELSAFTVQLISVCCCTILSVILFTLYIPANTVFKNYVVGRRCLAVAYLLPALSTLIVLSCDNKPCLWAQVNSTLCTAPFLALFFSASFIVLVEPEFNLKRFLIKQILYIGIFVFLLLTSHFLLKNSPWRMPIHYTGVVAYISFIIYYIWMFYKKYIAYAEQLSARDSKQNKSLQWFKHTYTSVLTIAFLSIVVSVYTNRNAFLVFTAVYTGFFSLFTVIYINYARFLIHEKKESIPVAAKPEKAEKEWTRIEDRIKLWIAERKYLQTGITLDHLSKELGVNRTYLSRYINTSYQTNYNTWINRLRINESKKIMREQQHLSISDVAEQVGFADVAHFSKQFKQIEGTPPSQWNKQVCDIVSTS